MFLRLFALSLLVSSTLLSVASAFTFSPGTPTQCDSLSISWDGGTAPFFLHVIPVFGTPRNVSIPPSAFNNGQGSFSLPQLPLPAGQDFLITMSDSNGFGTGGSTNILKVGPSKGGQCDTKDPGVDFTFELNSVLVQCRPYIFSGYPSAVQPVTIMGLIPSGNSFVLRPPLGSQQFSWVANVEQGTSVIFIMVDSRGRQGGASSVKLVGNSNDRSCLNGLSPSSTPAPPTIPQTSTSGSSSTRTNPSASSTAPPASTTSSTSSGGTSVGAVVGTVIGALLFIAVAVTLALFFLKKRKEARNAAATNRYSHPLGGTDLQPEPFGAHNPHSYSFSSTPNTAYGAPPNPYVPNPYTPQPYTHGYQPSAYTASTTNHGMHNPSLSGGQFSGSMLPYDPNPFLDTHQPAPSSQYPPPANYQYQSAYELPSASAYSLPNPFNNPTDRNQPLPPPPVEDPFAGSENETTTSAQQRKAALAGIPTYSKPARFVVHTDAEDILPPPNADGVVELPPQYTERRGLTVTNPSPSPTPSSDRYALSQPPTQRRPPPS